MANGILTEPYANFNFLVESDGITRAQFHECSGFNSSVEMIEYSEGGNLYPMKLPGPRQVFKHHAEAGHDL